MSEQTADTPASSDSDSAWETDDSVPRPSATRNSNRRGNTSTRRRQHAREMMPPSFDMSPFSDSALGDFMYGLEANGFGSILRESGIPPLGFGPEYGDFSSDSDDSDDSSDSDDSDDEEGEDDYDDEDDSDDDSDSLSSDDSSDDSDTQPRKRRLKEKRVDDSSSQMTLLKKKQRIGLCGRRKSRKNIKLRLPPRRNLPMALPETPNWLNLQKRSKMLQSLPRQRPQISPPAALPTTSS
jgi:hypothetical protein